MCWHTNEFVVKQCYRTSASFVETRRPTKFAASFVEIKEVTRFHKTCSKFCEQNFPRKDWKIQNLLQVLFLVASFVSRKDQPYLHQYLSSQHKTTLKSIANLQSIVSSL
jgi:hypothetical protein